MALRSRPHARLAHCAGAALCASAQSLCPQNSASSSDVRALRTRPCSALATRSPIAALPPATASALRLASCMSPQMQLDGEEMRPAFNFIALSWGSLNCVRGPSCHLSAALPLHRAVSPSLELVASHLRADPAQLDTCALSYIYSTVQCTHFWHLMDNFELLADYFLSFSYPEQMLRN